MLIFSVANGFTMSFKKLHSNECRSSLTSLPHAQPLTAPRSGALIRDKGAQPGDITAERHLDWRARRRFITPPSPRVIKAQAGLSTS
ncbi:hypothetical protein SKAU_G00317620 [Synaphobranchus kaupii]|uniref:Uncharacterized protein n=1 Tax=Synaphobranchus kaupii TaxID=118154 RepID=A0A9Q1ET50_SYNKA|nr:hypothetical protein SKAU_G00317620 [Synaphobranchus kaupii]